jgi:predicted nucleic-acid-binding Zn-ribbon protein
MKCAKCGGEMEVGILAGAFHWGAGTGVFHTKSNKVFAYKCPNCGYVELYAR